MVPPPEPRRGPTWLGPLGPGVVAASIFWSLARLGVTGDWPVLAINQASGSVESIGIHLLTTYSMAFEAISLVLLVAILGAIAIARTGRHHVSS